MKTTAQTLACRITRMGLLFCGACAYLFVSNSSAQNNPFDYIPEQNSSEESVEQDMDSSEGDSFSDEMSDEPQTAQSMGLLENTLSYGVDGNWTGSVEGNSYRISGPKADSDIKYFIVNTAEETWGKRTFQVNVDSSQGNGAGLIYGFQENPKQYYMILVTSSNGLKVLQRNQEGVEERMSSSFEHEGGPVALKIQEEGNSINIFVNGNKVIGLGNDSMGKGAVGIIAVNAGEYVFSDFEFTVDDK